MNIYDIADKAGVSIATVSRVVNGSPKVSERTREKVLGIIEEFGYTPNAFAQGLGLNTMHTVGIMVPSISDNYMANAVYYLEESLHEQGYECILSCSGFLAEQKESHLQMLLSKKADALILVGSTYAGSEDKTHNTEYINLASKEVPVFLINGLVTGDNIYCTATDDEKAIYEATKSLLENGRKKILFMTDSRSYSAKQKKKGFLLAHKDYGMVPDERLDLYIRNDVEEVKSKIAEYDSIGFDAVVATDDAMAIGVLKFMTEHGRKVPEDVSIVGYNNSSLCVCTTPELTSIDNKVEMVSKCTVDRLIKVLNGETDVSHKEVFDCELIKRGTM